MEMVPRTGFLFDDAFLRHNAAIDHPECPARLRSVQERLATSGLLEQMVVLPAERATDDDLMQVHTRAHIHAIERSEGRWLDPDTFVGAGSAAIARLAVGGVAKAAREVWSGELKSAFCPVRPPGHHASRDRSMGFCLYNNIAVATMAVRNAGARRVFILDWDVHHGNGTQAIFYEDPAVLYASVHQYPFYPGTGAAYETGRGPGVGATVNRPVPAGAGDEVFLTSIGDILENYARAFRPEIVMISAGFDAHQDDPLGGLEVTTGAFKAATQMICKFAADTCNGRIVSVLEGGYNVDALADCAESHVAGLLESSGASANL